jgi:hypothetical protein
MTESYFGRMSGAARSGDRPKVSDNVSVSCDWKGAQMLSLNKWVAR